MHAYVTVGSCGRRRVCVRACAHDVRVAGGACTPVHVHVSRRVYVQVCEVACVRVCVTRSQPIHIYTCTRPYMHTCTHMHDIIHDTCTANQVYTQLGAYMSVSTSTVEHVLLLNSRDRVRDNVRGHVL